jgi:hypothetical protein
VRCNQCIQANRWHRFGFRNRVFISFYSRREGGLRLPRYSSLLRHWRECVHRVKTRHKALNHRARPLSEGAAQMHFVRELNPARMKILTRDGVSSCLTPCDEAEIQRRGCNFTSALSIAQTRSAAPPPPLARRRLVTEFRHEFGLYQHGIRRCTGDTRQERHKVRGLMGSEPEFVELPLAPGDGK